MTRRASKSVAVVLLALLAACSADHSVHTGWRDPGMPIGTPCGGLSQQHVDDAIIFKRNNTRLTAEAQHTLDQHAQWLRCYVANRIVIQGRADEKPSDAENYELAKARALKDKAYLVSKGIDPARLSVMACVMPVGACAVSKPVPPRSAYSFIEGEPEEETHAR